MLDCSAADSKVSYLNPFFRIPQAAGNENHNRLKCKKEINLQKMTEFITIFVLYIYLMMCTVSDIKTKKISLKLSLVFLFLGLFIYMFFIKADAIILLYNLIPGICLFLVSLFTKGAVGCGDAVILMVMSFYMPSASILIILFLSLLAASVVSVRLIMKKYSRKYTLPFAPFITLGYTIFLLT